MHKWLPPSIQKYLQPQNKWQMVGSKGNKKQYTTKHIYHIETIRITTISEINMSIQHRRFMPTLKNKYKQTHKAYVHKTNYISKYRK